MERVRRGIFSWFRAATPQLDAATSYTLILWLFFGLPGFLVFVFHSALFRWSSLFVVCTWVLTLFVTICECCWKGFNKVQTKEKVQINETYHRDKLGDTGEDAGGKHRAASWEKHGWTRHRLTKTWGRGKTRYRHTNEGIRYRWGKGTEKHRKEGKSHRGRIRKAKCDT